MSTSLDKKDSLMNELELAALKRKHAATQELAKRNELANLLKAAGHDPDAVEPISVAPEGRTAPVKVTAKPSSKDAPVTGPKKRGRPARSQKITGSGGITLPSVAAK